MKNLIRFVALVFLLIGVFFLLFNLAFIASSKKQDASIIDVLERRTGTSYVSVQKGSEYPCKLKVKTTDSAEGVITRAEYNPCSSSFTWPWSYYQVGQSIKVYTDGQSAEVANLFFLIVLPLVMSVIGMISLKYLNIPVIFKRKQAR